MPTHRQHALITWIPESVDGQREARRLHARYRDYSVLRTPTKLAGADYMSVIVVGHRSEFTTQMQEAFVQLLQGSTWVVLALCDSGLAKFKGTLGDNEFWSPAQKLANRMRIRVSSTIRPLTFDEVGMGHAFTLSLGEILIRINPPSSHALWRDCEPQSGVDELSEGISRL